MADPLTVSMYNVGFGDCFLVSLPPGPSSRGARILIDCGSIKADGSSIAEIVDRVIGDVEGEGGAHIDVVVMSHRHRDHISGFADSRWDSVRVDEVWMPWTEGPDPIARDLRSITLEFQRTLIKEVMALGDINALSGSSVGAIEHVLVNSLLPESTIEELKQLISLREANDLSDSTHRVVKRVVKNSLLATNDDAMATLHRGFLGGAHGARRRYLSTDDASFRTSVLPDVDVHVLGPSRNPEVIAKMVPPHNESFLRAVKTPAGSDVRLPFEFAKRPDTDLPEQALRDRLHALSDESLLYAAAAFENAVNNTSLFLVLEVGEAVLVFPGDSQWGSWEAALRDRTHSDLLRRTSFYKVGHHGSHNSTPASFVGLLGGEFWAATSVQPHDAFPQIPREPTLEALRGRLTASDNEAARVVRSDSPPDQASAPVGVRVVNSDRIDFTIPTD